MEIGVTIYPHFVTKDKSLASILADVKIKNYDFVSIFPHTLGLIKNGTVVEKNLKGVEAALKGVGIEYIVRMPTSVNLRDNIYYTRHFRVAKAVADVAIKLGAKVIVMQSGRTGRLDLEIEAIQLLADMVGPFGIKIALENTFSVKDTLYVVDNVERDNVGFALDVAHAFLSAQGNEEKLLEDVKLGTDKTVILMIHDNFGIPPGRAGRCPGLRRRRPPPPARGGEHTLRKGSQALRRRSTAPEGKGPRDLCQGPQQAGANRAPHESLRASPLSPCRELQEPSLSPLSSS